MLFDTGAQRSFVHKSLAQALRLRTDFTEGIHLGVFSQLAATPMKVPVSQIGIKLPSGDSIPIEASHIKQLIGDCAYYPVESEDDPALSLPIFKGETQIISPLIVIGIDYFWQFKPEVIRKLPSGYTLLKTALGFHICGRGRAELTNVSAVNEIVATAITAEQHLENVPV